MGQKLFPWSWMRIQTRNTVLTCFFFRFSTALSHALCDNSIPTPTFIYTGKTFIYTGKLWSHALVVGYLFYMLTLWALCGLGQWLRGSQLCTYGPKCVWSKRYANYVCVIEEKKKRRVGRKKGGNLLIFLLVQGKYRECENLNKMGLNRVVGCSSKMVIYKTLQNMLILHFRSTSQIKVKKYFLVKSHVPNHKSKDS